MTDRNMAPIFVSPGDRQIVVFGGGKVALRKIGHFKGFRIKVVSKEVLPEVRDAADEVIITDISENSIKENIEGAFIAVAATSDKAINAMIRDTAMAEGIMANSAHGGGDVLIPSVLNKRNFTVTVSTSGTVPAFPPYVVRKIDGLLDDSYDLMMDMLIELRPVIKEKVKTQPERAKLLADILDNQSIWNMLSSGKTEEAIKEAKRMGDLE